MKSILISSLIFSSLSLPVMAASFDKPAYQIYNNENKPVQYSNLIEQAKNADVILFGELHNNPIAHWLELEITKDIFAVKKDKLILGAEMFESDNQLVLDEYLQNKIKEEHLIESGQAWKNYKTDYKPLIEFAKTNHLNFIATNIPSRYSSYVSRNGISSLSDLTQAAKPYFAPLPVKVDFELSSYKNMMQMFGSGHGSSVNVKYIIEAQAVKDATMAYFINKNLKPNSTFIHYNGSYHSDNYQGIYWYLKKYKPDLKILTVSSVESNDISKNEGTDINIADFVITIPENMTKTY